MTSILFQKVQSCRCLVVFAAYYVCSTIVIILHQMCSSFANFKERQSFGCVHLTTPFSQIVFRWTFHFPSTAHGNAFKKFTILCIIYDMNVNVKFFKILLYPH